MKLPSLPRTERTYQTQAWPHVIKYRAFTAGQQSLLLQVADNETPAQERVDTMSQVFDECVDAGVPFAEIPVGIVEKIFLLMRCISIGEVMKINYKCNNPVIREIPSEEDDSATIQREEECGQQLVVPIPLDKIDIRIEPEFKDTFELPGGYFLKMRVPSFSDVSILDRKDITIELLIATFVECLYDTDGQSWEIANPGKAGLSTEQRKAAQHEFDELVVWVRDNIESDILADITQNFFNRIPRIFYATEVKCPGCGKMHPIKFNSLQQIFI